jgi:GTP pyrophosphokinase
MKTIVTDFSANIQSYDAKEKERILRAKLLANELYEKQNLAEGISHIEHPLAVAGILTNLKLDTDAVIAALLHDAFENGLTTSEKITEEFGEEVTLIVEGLARIADISAKNKTNHEAENIRKMLFAMVKDIRVILIKLADKLHNMQTLDHFPETGFQGNLRKAVAQECLDIYAPLADRLGISWMKDELEDLSLKQLNREAYSQIKEIVALKKNERKEFLERVQKDITKETNNAGISIEIKSRAKHFYSIYQKMRKRSKEAGELFDLFGIRILCNTIENCYTLLGIVHRLWKPLDGRFKDYIAMPKSNGYQSLHTTVMSFNGNLLEIQIRTFNMHNTAEYGVASHWLYKKGSTTEVIRPEDISIVNRLKDWNLAENERHNSVSFLDDIKREILKDSIYVFTPLGKVIELPAGATPIDFAYAIHTSVGEHCMGAKADGSIVPLTSELKNTQVVEILTAPSAHPNVNWLQGVKTSKARSKIRSWLQQNDDSIIIEKNVVAKKKIPPPENNQSAAAQLLKTQLLKHQLEKPEDFFQNRVISDEILNDQVLQVTVEDEKNMMIRFARCCQPIVGDPIIGYVSRGRGIIIHRKNCSNLKNIPDFAERKIDTEWENANTFLIKRFTIEARRSAALFSEIEGAVRKHQGHLIEGRLEETKTDHLTGFFTMKLDNKDDLKKVMKSIRTIPSVYSVMLN